MFSFHFSENRQYVEEGYRNIPFPFEEIGYFTYVSTYEWSLDDLQGYLQSWSTVQKFMNTNDKNPTKGIIKRLSPDWPLTKTVEFPVFLRLGRIRL